MAIKKKIRGFPGTMRLCRDKFCKCALNYCYNISLVLANDQIITQESSEDFKISDEKLVVISQGPQKGNFTFSS